MEKQKTLNAIGIAYGARKIISGAKLFDFVKNKKVLLVILGSDMGPSQKKKLINKCTFYQIEYYDDLLTVGELSHACGKDIQVAIGLNDINMVKLIKSTL